jgi:hypothetical protein
MITTSLSFANSEFTFANNLRLNTNRPTHVEHEYFRMAAWDVHRARVFGRCEVKSGIAPVDRLVGEVMAQERPEGFALSGNTLLVANCGRNMVGEYNATNGAAINPNFITGLNGPFSLAVASVPEPSPWSTIAVGSVALLGNAPEETPPQNE